uniref:Uncharacterized protein n=1 Tax=Tanacetum cinerariifolium TaxID=118510 RepID=A0A6L2KBX4_TANCI|nr:hypothetical protein [Tanacetum cinerariifolium]
MFLLLQLVIREHHQADNFIFDISVFKHIADFKEFVNVFVRIGFGSTIKLVSFDKSQVVTFNSKFIYGFRNSDCGAKSRSDNMVGNPHSFIIHWFVVSNNIEEVTEVIDVTNLMVDNSRVLWWIISLVEWNSSVLSMESSIQNLYSSSGVVFLVDEWMRDKRIHVMCIFKDERNGEEYIESENSSSIYRVILDEKYGAHKRLCGALGDVEEVGDLSLEAMEDDEVALVDGVFEGALCALGDESWCFGLEVEAFVDAIKVMMVDDE